MLYEIVEAIAHPDHTVTITWSDGARGVSISCRSSIGVAGSRRCATATTSRPTMIVLDGGAGLTWPEEIDYASDALRRDAFPHGMPG